MLCLLLSEKYSLTVLQDRFGQSASEMGGEENVIMSVMTSA